MNVCVSSLYVLVLFAFISMTCTGKHSDLCLLVKDAVHLVFVTTKRGDSCVLTRRGQFPEVTVSPSQKIP